MSNGDPNKKKKTVKVGDWSVSGNERSRIIETRIEGGIKMAEWTTEQREWYNTAMGKIKDDCPNCPDDEIEEIYEGIQDMGVTKKYKSGGPVNIDFNMRPGFGLGSLAKAGAKGVFNKGIRPFGTKAAVVPLNYYTISQNLKEGENIADAVIDPFVGLEFLLPGLFKENVDKITKKKAIQKLLNLGYKIPKTAFTVSRL